MDRTFEEYVATRGEALLRLAFLLCADRHLAEDLVQEVLARVYDRWHRLSHEEQSDAYLRTAVVRRFLSWWRRRASRETSRELVAEPASTTPDASSQAARNELWRLLATRPRKQRAVLVLRFYEDLPDEDIAKALGCRPATVRVHASRALARLREALDHSTGLPQPVGGES